MNTVTHEGLGSDFVNALARREQASLALAGIVATSEYPLPTQDHITTPGYPEAWEELQTAQSFIPTLTARLDGRTITVRALDDRAQPISHLRRGRGLRSRNFREVGRSSLWTGVFLNMLGEEPIVMFDQRGRHHCETRILNYDLQPQVSIVIED